MNTELVNNTFHQKSLLLVLRDMSLNKYDIKSFSKGTFNESYKYLIQLKMVEFKK